MLEINLEFFQHLRQQSNVVLRGVHDKLKHDGFGLNDVGKGLIGDLLFTDRRGREHAVVVRST